jgi:membrane fusion protein, multidrug efflux system
MGFGKWLGVPVAVMVLVGLAGCGESASSDLSATKVSSSDTSSYGTNAITLNVYPGSITMSGVDSKMHDAVLPSSWVVKKGQVFTITAINYDGGPHSITAPDLGLDFLIKAGNEDKATKQVTPVTSTITFTATKTGDFHWYCKEPCDGPTHLGMEMTGNNGRGYDEIMAGEIVVQD